MPIDDNSYSFYVDDNTADYITVKRELVTPVIWATTTSTSIPNIYESHKHFNCKRCGAPNQIDVCKYCGCAAED